MKRNVLVTGGAGYIGSHTCKALAKKGYFPISYDSLIIGNRDAVRWGPLEVGDINDRTRLEEVIKKYRPQGVLHFAAFAYIEESMNDPGKYYRNNVAGSITLIETLRDYGIKKFIFSSSCATYGIPDQIPIKENHPQKPINPYGASKLMIERILKDFEMAHGVQSIILRYFNAAGADPDNEIGETHSPETHLIPLVLEVAASKRPVITINGDNFDTSDGTCVRDYIHVSDLADAHILALDSLVENHKSSVYNLGNGNGYSVREVIEYAEKVTGYKIPVIIGQQRAGDPPHLVGDASKICNELGWKPKYASLQTILATAWAWHNK